jgi:multidrug efflux pump subunit AcrA (membrane-fusion protein)
VKVNISPRTILTGFGAVLLCAISYRACSSCSDSRETTAMVPAPVTTQVAAPVAATPQAPAAQAPARPRRAADEYVGALTTRRTAVVTVEFEARVEELLVNMGDKVMLGDPLARLDDRPLRQKLTAAQATAEAAEATHRSASLDLEDAQRRLERGTFRDDGNSDVDMAEASLRKADEALRAARAEVMAVERQVASATLTAGVKVPGTVRQDAPEMEPAGRVVLVEAELDEGADALRRLPVQIGAVGRVRLARPPG